MNPPSATSKQAAWQWIALIWVSIALFSAIQNVLVMQAEKHRFSLSRLFVLLVLSWLFWVLARPPVLPRSRQFRPGGFSSIPSWCIHFGAFAMISLASAAWEAALEVFLNPFLKSP